MDNSTIEAARDWVAAFDWDSHAKKRDEDKFEMTRDGLIRDLTSFAAEQLSAIKDERDAMMDDLKSLENACFYCAQSEIYGGPIRHFHEPEGWHWHHYLDPGDGLPSPCSNSELFERVLSEQVSAALDTFIEQVETKLGNASCGCGYCSKCSPFEVMRSVAGRRKGK